MLSESYFDFKSYVDTSQSLTAIAGESIPEQFPTYLEKAKSLKNDLGSKYVMQFENIIEHKLKLLVSAEAPEYVK